MNAIIAASQMDSHHNSDEMSRADLDSHAKMAVFGRNFLVTYKTGKHTKVNAFSPGVDLNKIPIIDATIC